MEIRSGMATTISGSEFRFTSEDGLRIACTRWDSRGPVRGVLQIAHGMGEHILRYVELIEVLVSAGMTVYGNDHRGHGRTAPDAAHFGDFGEGGFDLLVRDMVRLSRIAKEEHPEPPFILLGHSMSSFAAQQYVLDHSREIDGLILSGSGALDGLARPRRADHAAHDEAFASGVSRRRAGLVERTFHVGSCRRALRLGRNRRAGRQDQNRSDQCCAELHCSSPQSNNSPCIRSATR